jgi:hypothetical protein
LGPSCYPKIAGLFDGGLGAVKQTRASEQAVRGSGKHGRRKAAGNALRDQTQQFKAKNHPNPSTRKESKMNLTLGNTFPRTWKRFGAQHVAVAAAAAIALTLALAAGFTLTGDSGGGKPSGPVGTGSTISARAVPNDTTYYIVGSQSEATRLEEGIAIAALEAGSAGYEWISSERVIPFVIETLEQEMQFQSALMELQHANPYGSDVNVVDLRR